MAKAAVLKVSMGTASSTASKVPDIAFAMAVRIMQQFQWSPGAFNTKRYHGCTHKKRDSSRGCKG